MYTPSAPRKRPTRVMRTPPTRPIGRWLRRLAPRASASAIRPSSRPGATAQPAWIRSRSDRRVRTIPTGTAATEARPNTTAAQARTFAFLLLLVGNAIRRGRNRAADDSGDRYEREQVRQRGEKRRDRGRVRLQVDPECAREPEQQTGGCGAERPPAAEDQCGKSDEPAPRRHVLGERAAEP